VAWVLLVCLASGCATLSYPEEQQLGDQSAEEINRQLDFLRDRWVVHYVDEIGREILEAAGPQPFEYRFHVVEDPELNAFALPAGYIYVNTGVILAAENVSELAGVMAHEVGHDVLRHVAQNYHRQRNTGLLYQLVAAALSIFVGGYAASGGQLLGQLGAVAYVNSFTREAEEAADAFAVDAMPRAGYDPSGLVSFFAKLQAEGGPSAPSFISSHPATQDRIDAASARIRQIDLPPGLRVTDNGELEIIQRRIQLLTGAVSP
jgi:predicted Zn-dependent protease